MSGSFRPHELHVPAWISASELQKHSDGFVRYLLECGYSKSTLHPYRNAVAHLRTGLRCAGWNRQLVAEYSDSAPGRTNEGPAGGSRSTGYQY
jgi:hypothetical protein